LVARDFPHARVKRTERKTLRTPVHTERGKHGGGNFSSLAASWLLPVFYGSSLFLPVIVLAEPLALDRFVNMRSHDEYDGRDHRARPCKPSQAYWQSVPMCSVAAVGLLGSYEMEGTRRVVTRRKRCAASLFGDDAR
jgi:hypothetical protein